MPGVAQAVIVVNFPAEILISADGRWMYASNQNSNSVTAFRVDPASGEISPAGEPLATPSPVCLLIGGTTG
ncbi:beta-propeller fold lactonase family protein [Saccharopolyspora shandongensis]|uniref:beta-propeller fold lactonase family protein n=1 Tax=Saccharopolyspora shandongensis TaxID=418495 RepID=UPI00340EC760